MKDIRVMPVWMDTGTIVYDRTEHAFRHLYCIHPDIKIMEKEKNSLLSLVLHRSVPGSALVSALLILTALLFLAGCTGCTETDKNGCCNGKSYDKINQSCDNGSIYECPSSQLCAGTCLNPDTQSCYNNSIYDCPWMKMCGGTCYDPDTQSCCNDQVKVDTGWFPCGNSCYYSKTENCVQEMRVPITPGSKTTTEKSGTETEGSFTPGTLEPTEYCTTDGNCKPCPEGMGTPVRTVESDRIKCECSKVTSENGYTRETIVEHYCYFSNS